MPTYFLSQTYQLCLTDITYLLISCRRHISCVLQTLHAYICLVIDTSIMSYRHYTPAYVLSETHQLCLTNMTHLHMSCHRHCNCVLQTSHTYICLVIDTSIAFNRHHTSTYVLSQTHPLCLTDITHLHIACNRHISCVLQTSHVCIYLVTETSIVSYRHHTSTSTAIVSYRHHMSSYVLSQTHQLCLTDITRLHISCHRQCNCILQTSHAYICLVTDTSFVS